MKNVSRKCSFVFRRFDYVVQFDIKHCLNLIAKCFRVYFFTFVEVKGWNSHHPGHSCKDIRDSGDSKGDGEYWIDPEKGGNPLKVFCDMTTDGGKLRMANKEFLNLLTHFHLFGTRADETFLDLFSFSLKVYFSQ